MTLSRQLDEALAMEEHHREQLLYWKQRRLELQGQVPDDFNDLFNQIRTLLGASTDDDNNQLSTNPSRPRPESSG